MEEEEEEKLRPEKEQEANHPSEALAFILSERGP